MNLPKISVITPSYNQADYIKDTIDSILSQDYPRLEYIIIDGGSTDGTVDILKQYGNKINWVSQKDQGQSHAINKGLKKSSGDLLAYLNSDDIYLPGALKKVGQYYATNQPVDWITGDYQIIDQKGDLTVNHWLITKYKRLLMRFYSPTLLKITDSMFPQPSTFWSKKAYLKVGDFRTDFHYVMDYDYWLRLSKHYQPHDLKVPLSGFRTQPQSKSQTDRKTFTTEGVKTLTANQANRLEIFLHQLHNQISRQIYKIWE